MESYSRSLASGESMLEQLMPERIRATIETIADEELAAAPGGAVVAT